MNSATADGAAKEKPKHGTRGTGFWVLVATISASSMAFIDSSALNITLPAIQSDLQASGGDLLWIVNIYQLMLASLILVGGSLGDHFGRKRIYLTGIALFTAASAACGFAPTTGLLIAGRAIQGIGGALMVPGSLAIVSAYFDDKSRGRAIGIWSSFTTMTSVLGPILGGLLVDANFWRGIFFINVPLAALAVFALLRFVPESRDEDAPRQLDWLGTALVTVGLAGIVFGATELGRFDEGRLAPTPVLIASLVIGVLALIAFVFVEARSRHPLVSLKLFASRTFSGANALTLFLYGALTGALLFLPLNLQQIQGYTGTQASLALIPFSILLIIISPWMGNIVNRFGPRLPLVVGPTLVGFGFITLSLPGITDGINSYLMTYFPGAILLGLGMGITVAPLTTSVMGSVPQRSAGVASGINNAVARAAGVLAIAVMGGIALSTFMSTLNTSLETRAIPEDVRSEVLTNADDLGATEAPEVTDEEVANAVNTSVAESFLQTFRLMMYIGAGMAWLSALLAFLLVENKLRPHAAQTANAPA
jgi:EmrB/QacA subfamily drug resistance transporter